MVKHSYNLQNVIEKQSFECLATKELSCFENFGSLCKQSLLCRKDQRLTMNCLEPACLPDGLSIFTWLWNTLRFHSDTFNQIIYEFNQPFDGDGSWLINYNILVKGTTNLFDEHNEQITAFQRIHEIDFVQIVVSETLNSSIFGCYMDIYRKTNHVLKFWFIQKST